MLTAPAPPPPPLNISKETSKISSNREVNSDLAAESDRSYLTAVRRWVAGTSNEGNRIYGFWQNLPSVLQEGPQYIICGLVCLSMASYFVTKERAGIPVTTIFETAKARNYTKLGEMFSAHDMAALAMEILQCPAKAVKNLLDDHAQVAEILLGNRVILVPYDADFNHEPCCTKGVRAHWAIVHGFAVASDSCAKDFAMEATDDPFVFKLSATSVSNSIKLDSGMDFAVFARQGKSRHLGCWSLTQLSKSNRNLVIVDTKRSPEDYILPAEGIAQTLCNWAVVLG